jgi:hypothetical protein
MRMNRVLMAAALAGAAISVTACGHAKESLGMSKATPDEFRVVSKAPLVIPPDYALRPPMPGEPRPAELQPESAARQTVLAQRAGLDRSEGERLLVAKAGADRADPLVKYVVDDENGDLSYKEKSFAEKVMFWKKDAQPAQTEASATVDPAAEAERLKELTGGRQILIQKQQAKFKLPGL